MKTSLPPAGQQPEQAATVHAADDPRTLKQVLKENEYLRAEVAYLKKLRALIQEKDRAAQKKRG
jgi:transposase